MKIVAFEGQGGPRLGVVDGDTVVDLNAVDSAVPTDLGEWLKRNDGDTKPLADIAKRAAAARAPAARGLDLPAAHWPAGQGHLPRVELSRARQGRRAARQHSKVPDHFYAQPDLAGAARPADHPPASDRDPRLRSGNDPDRRPARQAFDRGRCALVRRRLFVRQRGLGARVPAQNHAMGHGQEFRPHRRLRALVRQRRRAAAGRQGIEDREPVERPGDAIGQYRQHDVPDCARCWFTSPRV